MIPTAQDMLSIIRLGRPLSLLSTAMLYGLGAAVASFLGKPLSGPRYLFGQAMVIALQLTANYLEVYYDERRVAESTLDPEQAQNDTLVPGDRSRRLALYAAIVCIVLAGTLTSITLVHGGIPPTSWLIMALLTLSALTFGPPPLRLAVSGYGELIASVSLAGLVPILAYTLQTGDMSRLLVMSTTPLIALHFALMIALQVPDYASDIQYNRRRIMVRLGWSSAMWLHDVAILTAILILAAAFSYGLPPRVAAGTLIALPLAAAQIWQMERLRRGYPARWRPLTIGAMSLFGLMTYLELIGYILS